MAAGPVEAESRIELVDALRGFALGGVLFINLRLFTQFDFLNEHQYAQLASAPYDEILLLFANVFGDGKFISLFSMLFGYGFMLQLQRLDARGEPAVRIYVRRLIGLLLIGLAHSMLWWGDILRDYAMMGFLLILTRQWQAKTLAWSGLALAIAWVVVPTLTIGGPAADANQRAYAAFSSGSVADAFFGNAAHNWYEFVHYPWLLPFVLSRFLLGSAAGQAGVLADPASHRRLLFRMSIAGVIVGLVATVLIVAFDGTTNPWFVEDARGWNLLLGLNTIGFSIAYAAWFALLFIRPRWHTVLRHLAPVGRMCLTNYLTHTIVCILVFYGFGLGVGPRFGMPGVYLAWAVLFGTQMILSPLWLSRFRFGPAEWLWRSMTYGRIA